MSAVRRVGTLLGPLAGGWVLCWLLPGLLLGQPTALLEGSAPEAWKDLYIGLLYLVLLGATARAWHVAGPAPGSPGLGPPRLAGLVAGLAVGVGGAVLHRALLALGGWWTSPDPALRAVLEALLVAPLLAFAEEILFRGYLFGVLREELGRSRAYLLGNAFFAVVHLFRPGDGLFKAVYGVGLFLGGAVLCRLTEASGSLWPAIGLHAGWILLVVLDPPGRVTPGWLPGLGGDPAAGALGWLLLLALWASMGPVGRALRVMAARRP